MDENHYLNILKEILKEIKSIQEELTQEGTSNKIVIEMAKDNATFVKNVPGLSGAKNKGFGCDSHQEILLDNKTRQVTKEVKFKKTKITCGIIAILGLILTLVEIFTNLIN
jgi:hypothetical protein